MLRNTPMVQAELTEKLSYEQRIDSAVALVESGQSPMAGIMMLKEVVEEDPANLRAQKQLGVFSIQSGQYDKAKKRFKSIEESQPNDVDALYYLGHIYANEGENDTALIYFKRCRELSTDQAFTDELNEYINELNNI